MCFLRFIYLGVNYIGGKREVPSEGSSLAANFEVVWLQLKQTQFIDFYT